MGSDNNTNIPQELKDKEELDKTGKIRGRRPVDIIREMNPGKFIPTGQELAGMLKKQEDDKEDKNED